MSHFLPSGSQQRVAVSAVTTAALHDILCWRVLVFVCMLHQWQ